MKSNRFWLLLISALLCLSALAAFYVTRLAHPGATAYVYQNGQLLYSIKLDSSFDPYTRTVGGMFENTIAVEPGRICVQSATCPDGLCVRQGWISRGLVPIVCLPNGLVIQLEGGTDSGPDAVAQ